MSQDAVLRRIFVLNGTNLFLTFCLVSSLFLLWGFCNGLIDVMNKHFQDELHLTKAQSAWVQTAHYLGYALMALPAGMLARALGYKGSIISGLLIVSAGGFWFIAATAIASFWAFLLGVSVIAIGLTVLETVANPYSTLLGSPKFSALRINLAQGINGIGWMLGPIVGGAFFYSEEGAEAAQGRLYIPYVGMSLVVIALATTFCFSRIPDLAQPIVPSQDDHLPNKGSIWTRPHFVGAVLAQFLYVAAQAGIFSFFINYMVSQVPSVPNDTLASGLLKSGLTARGGELFINEHGAAELQGLLGFGLFLIGRLTGAALLSQTPAHRLLGLYSLINVVLCTLVVLNMGWLSVAALFLSFFFMSIGFPTIFALGIDGLGPEVKKASAFIVMAILGGAVMPKLMGHLGDVYDMSIAFLMPLGCFAVIAIYGCFWRVLRGGLVRGVA